MARLYDRMTSDPEEVYYNMCDLYIISLDPVGSLQAITEVITVYIKSSKKITLWHGVLMFASELSSNIEYTRTLPEVPNSK